MGFSTNAFLFIFLIGTLVVYIPTALILPRLKVPVLLIASLVFYSWADVTALPVLLAMTLINYGCGLMIEKYKMSRRERYERIFLAVGIVLDLAILIFFKYAKFILGISFMSLSGIAYLVDVYRRKVKAQRNILSFALFMSFFVKIVEGPIVRYSDVTRQMNRPEFTSARFTEGIRRFSVGLAKKVLLADQIGVVAHDILGTTNNSPWLAWLGIISYTIQLYLDFSGYTDMAIGLGKMFGIDFKENFNNPYISMSLTEFWRRWHMSLSKWLRDYFYIPIGGSRTGNTYVNLFLTFLLAGFWHGATLNYIVWGAWNGIILCIERFLRRNTKLVLPDLVRHVITLFLIMIGWVFFYFEDFNQALVFLPTLFGAGSTWNSGYTLRWYLSQRMVLTLIAGILCCTPMLDRIEEKLRENRIWDLLYLALLGVSILIVMSSTFQTFLYIRY